MILREALVGEIQAKGKIPWGKLDDLLKDSGNECSRFCQQVSRQGFMDRDSLGAIVAQSLNRTYMNLARTIFQPQVLAKITKENALKYRVIPVYQFGPAVTVAMAEPGDLGAVMVLEKMLGSQVDPVFSFDDEIEAAIKVNYESADKVTTLANTLDIESLVQLDESKLADLKPVVAISESILLMALKERVSDVHVEPKKNECWVRFRVDGDLKTRLRLSSGLMRPLAARYKVMANLDIAESRKPQDGRISFHTPIKDIDVRVSTLPVVHGEKIVMRLLGSLSSEIVLNLDRLAISEDVLTLFKSMLAEPNGIIFVTGPTGSGKSTTLYAGVNYIDSPDCNITTIEDPVEYEVTTLNQSGVDVKAGRTFPVLLRSILRQDPDVVLIGEIRDTETARIAAQAALTGHLVLSSLHTNNALQALTRLVDIGVEPYVVAPSVLGAIGQRLVRRICPSCRKAYKPDRRLLQKHFFWDGEVEIPELFKGEGCSECGGSGYKGRIGIHEAFRVTQEIRDCVLKGKPYSEIRELIYRNGFKDMRHDGFRKAFQGLTSIEEVVRATSSDV